MGGWSSFPPKKVQKSSSDDRSGLGRAAESFDASPDLTGGEVAGATDVACVEEVFRERPGDPERVLADVLGDERRVVAGGGEHPVDAPRRVEEVAGATVRRR